MSKHVAAQPFDTTNARIVRRKGVNGNRVRFQHNVTAAFSPWMPQPPSARTSESPVVAAVELTEGDLNAMTIAQLRVLAGYRKIAVPSKARKAELVAALTSI